MLDTSGFGDSRITASTTPRTIPITIETTVSSIVTRTPRVMRGSNRKSPTVPQPKRGLVAIEWIATAKRNSTIALAIQRPQCRTGTARISSGRMASPAAPGVVELSTTRS